MRLKMRSQLMHKVAAYWCIKMLYLHCCDLDIDKVNESYLELFIAVSSIIYTLLKMMSKNNKVAYLPNIFPNTLENELQIYLKYRRI